MNGPFPTGKKKSCGWKIFSTQWIFFLSPSKSFVIPIFSMMHMYLSTDAKSGQVIKFLLRYRRGEEGSRISSKIKLSQEPGFVGNFRWNEGVIKGLWTFNNGQISTWKIFFFGSKILRFGFDLSHIWTKGVQHIISSASQSMCPNLGASNKRKSALHRWRHPSNYTGKDWS